MLESFDRSARPDGAMKKSARVVDHAYEKHGIPPRLAYDAICTNAAPWLLQVPLIDFNGEMGGPDDQPAARNYTEVVVARRCPGPRVRTRRARSPADRLDQRRRRVPRLVAALRARTGRRGAAAGGGQRRDRRRARRRHRTAKFSDGMPGHRRLRRARRGNGDVAGCGQRDRHRDRRPRSSPGDLLRAVLGRQWPGGHGHRQADPSDLAGQQAPRGDVS